MSSWNVRRMSLVTALACAGLVGCSDDSDLAVDPGGDRIDMPVAYAFDSRLVDGRSSVAYGGQVVRNLLVQDLKIMIDALGQPGATAVTIDDFMALYEHDDADGLETLTTVDGRVLESSYSAIASDKNLVGKISPAVVLGFGETADALVRGWLAQIAARSQDASLLGTPHVYVTEDGLDLSQMVNKVLLGAVVYYQGTDVYLGGILERDNTSARNEGGTYTAMEHAWDEAFGYFGAARNYRAFTDAQLAGGVADYARDDNADGLIDLGAEYNHSFARNAGKRDAGGVGVDFTTTVFDAFLAGRTAIVNQDGVNDLGGYALAASRGWEDVIAATVVHYINDTLGDMANLGTPDENRIALAKHWAEMKAFTVCLQYNPDGRLTDANLMELHTAMGDAPISTGPGTDAYDAAVAQLDSAKELLQRVYGFSSANMAGW